MINFREIPCTDEREANMRTSRRTNLGNEPSCSTLVCARRNLSGRKYSGCGIDDDDHDALASCFGSVGRENIKSL